MYQTQLVLCSFIISFNPYIFNLILIITLEAKNDHFLQNWETGSEWLGNFPQVTQLTAGEAQFEPTFVSY